MDTRTTLKLLSSQMSLEPDTEHQPDSRDPACPTNKEEDQIHVYAAHLPNSKKIRLLKTLLTSACEKDCFYCPFRAGREFERAIFKPDEFAGLFNKLNLSGVVDGIFLSSGVAGGGVTTEDKLLDTADILRHKFSFRGYLHLKIMPGAEKDQVFRAMQLADRVSINLEAPNTHRLTRMAPQKQFFEELLQPLIWIDDIRRTLPADKGWNGRWASSVTQFVAGGSDKSDLELLTTTHWLYKKVRLKRAYFSAFSPVPNTPLENKPPVDPIREHRLYQASFLLRDYDFDVEDLPYSKEGNLPLDVDPKLAWANLNLAHEPVEINDAERHELIRIPGIGPRGADAIIKARLQGRLFEISNLRKLGIAIQRAAPFILMNGRRAPEQVLMFN